MDPADAAGGVYPCCPSNVWRVASGISIHATPTSAKNHEKSMSTGSPQKPVRIAAQIFSLSCGMR